MGLKCIAYFYNKVVIVWIFSDSVFDFVSNLFRTVIRRYPRSDIFKLNSCNDD